MRTRSRSTIVDAFPGGPFQVYHAKLPLGSNASFGYDQENCASFPLEEIDEVITDSPTFSKKTKPVEHVRHTVRMHECGLSQFYAYQWNEYKLKNTGVCSLWYYLTSPDNRGGPFSNPELKFYGSLKNGCTPTVVWDKSVDTLYVEARGRIYNTNSVQGLVNAIETPQLLGTLRDILMFLGVRRGKTVWREISNLSSLYLGYSFGIAPLVADIKKVHKDILQWSKLIRNLKKDQQFSYAKATCTGTSTFSNTSALSASGYSALTNPKNGSFWHGTLVNPEKPYRTVTLKARAQMQLHNSSLKAADALLRRYLANGPASLAWELVPFSFVVDWFVNTSVLIGRLDDILTFRETDIVDAWVTERVETYIPMVHHQRDNNLGYSFPEYVGAEIGSVGYQSYSRKSLQGGPLVSLSGNFGKRQAGYSLALLHQIVAKLKS